MPTQKLDSTTTLTVNPNKETLITHKNQTYEITSIQNEKIGGIEFHRYKTQQGEEFLHIPSQEKLVPPTTMPWYAYPPTTIVYLQRNYKHKMLEGAVEKAGGIFALKSQLEKHGTRMSNNFLYRHMHDLRDGIPVAKLVPILSYLRKDLDDANVHITAIGTCRAIRNPKMPFELGGKHGTRLLAARYGDGTLCAPHSRGPRFDYANNNAEMRRRVMESLTNIFHGPKMLNREKAGSEVAKVRTSSDIIGHTLKRAGATVGELVEQNPHVPSHILQGPLENRIEWLIQSYGDEGYLWPQKGKVCIGRSILVTFWLSDDMRQRLGNLKWQAKIINGNWICDLISYKEIPHDILEVVSSHPPNLLLDEREILRGLGIETGMYPMEMHKGKYADYSAHWVLQTESREDGRRFFEKVGFPQKRKRAELLSALRLDGRRNPGTIKRLGERPAKRHQLELQNSPLKTTQKARE